MKDCPSCRNSGVDGGGEPCERCDGRGWVQEGVEKRSRLFGDFQRLWTDYRQALGVSIATLSVSERQENARQVAECYEALNQLAKEG